MMALYRQNMSDLSSNADGSPLSVLHVATVNGDKSSIELLLKRSHLDEYRCDVNERDKCGRTALVYAIFSDWYDCAELLLKNGATICSLDCDQRSAFHWAAYLGKDKFIGLLLKYVDTNINWNTPDLDGRTPLHYATAHKNSKCVRLLLRYLHSTMLDITDIEKKTPLHYSVYYGKFDQVKLLRDCGAKVHLRDAKWNSLLHLAVGNVTQDAVKIVKYLLRTNRFYSTQKDCEGRTPLHLAVGKENEVLVKELSMAEESALDELDSLSRSPLHYAVLQNNVNILTILITNGASLYKEDSVGATPLHYIAKNNSVSLLERLLSLKKVVDAADKEGRTAMMWAASAGAKDVLELMLKTPQSFDIHAGDHKGMTALHFACLAGHLSCVMLLIANSANIRQQDKLGQTALFKACRQGHINVADFLINNELFYLGSFINSGKGVTIVDPRGQNPTSGELNQTFEEESNCASKTDKDVTAPKKHPLNRHDMITQADKQQVPNKKISTAEGRLAMNRKEFIRTLDDCNRCTPLHFAAHSGHVDVCRWLLENGVDPQKKDSGGRTALHGAAFNGHIICMGLMLEHCPGLNNDRDDDGYSVLHRAAVNGHLEAVKMLVLEHNAFPNFRVKSSNLTPLDLAMGADQQDVTQFLIDHGGLTIAGVQEVASDTIKRYFREWSTLKQKTTLKPLIEKHMLLTGELSGKSSKFELVGEPGEPTTTRHLDHGQIVDDRGYDDVFVDQIVPRGFIDTQRLSTVTEEQSVRDNVNKSVENYSTDEVNHSVADQDVTGGLVGTQSQGLSTVTEEQSVDNVNKNFKNNSQNGLVNRSVNQDVPRGHVGTKRLNAIAEEQSFDNVNENIKFFYENERMNTTKESTTDIVVGNIVSDGNGSGCGTVDNIIQNGINQSVVQHGAVSDNCSEKLNVTNADIGQGSNKVENSSSVNADASGSQTAHFDNDKDFKCSSGRYGHITVTNKIENNNSVDASSETASKQSCTSDSELICPTIEDGQNCFAFTGQVCQDSVGDNVGDKKTAFLPNDVDADPRRQETGRADTAFSKVDDISLSCSFNADEFSHKVTTSVENDVAQSFNVENQIATDAPKGIHVDSYPFSNVNNKEGHSHFISSESIVKGYTENIVDDTFPEKKLECNFKNPTPRFDKTSANTSTNTNNIDIENNQYHHTTTIDMVRTANDASANVNFQSTTLGTAFSGEFGDMCQQNDSELPTLDNKVDQNNSGDKNRPFNEKSTDMVGTGKNQDGGSVSVDFGTSSSDECYNIAQKSESKLSILDNKTDEGNVGPNNTIGPHFLGQQSGLGLEVVQVNKERSENVEIASSNKNCNVDYHRNSHCETQELVNVVLEPSSCNSEDKNLASSVCVKLKTDNLRLERPKFSENVHTKEGIDSPVNGKGRTLLHLAAECGDPVSQHMPKPPPPDPGGRLKHSGHRVITNNAPAGDIGRVSRMQGHWGRVEAVRRSVAASVVIQRAFRGYLRRTGWKSAVERRPVAQNGSSNEPIGCPHKKLVPRSTRRNTKTFSRHLTSRFPPMNKTASISDENSTFDYFDMTGNWGTREAVERWLSKGTIGDSRLPTNAGGTRSENLPSRKTLDEYLRSQSLPCGNETISTRMTRSRSCQGPRGRRLLSGVPRQRCLSRETEIRKVYASPAAVSYNFAMETYRPLTSRRVCPKTALLSKSGTRARPGSMRREVNGWVSNTSTKNTRDTIPQSPPLQ